MVVAACTGVLAISGLAFPNTPSDTNTDNGFPIKGELFISQFQGSEGITFNAKGELFIGANNSIWIADNKGAVKKIADVHRHLGQARIGARDILAADFGPTNIFADGPNDDGLVWRITPDGKKTVVARGIADPNFILVLPDKSFLVSDDGTNKIYRVKDGVVKIWTTLIPHPNGMAQSRDGSIVYVAQSFKSIGPVVKDDRVWAVKIKNGEPLGEPTVAFSTGEGAIDGLIADHRGRVYVADNGAGKIVRFDPVTGKQELVAGGMPAVASLVFGEGRFDRESLYVTTTMRGGGKIWKVRVPGARAGRFYH